jgi:hypothetical protein
MPVERRTQKGSRSCEEQVGKGISHLAWFVDECRRSRGAHWWSCDDLLMKLDLSESIPTSFQDEASSRSSQRRAADRPREVGVPHSGRQHGLLVNWKDAIEFTGGSSIRSPTWRASCLCFTGCPPRDIPKVVSLGDDTPRSGTRRCKEHKT